MTLLAFPSNSESTFYVVCCSMHCVEQTWIFEAGGNRTSSILGDTLSGLVDSQLEGREKFHKDTSQLPVVS